MPKAAPPKRFTWRVALVLMSALLLFVVLFESSAMAMRRVQSILFADERFFLESSFVHGGPASDLPGIQVIGNRYTPRERIMLVFAPDINKSIFRIPLAERRRRLMGIDWIEDAAVMRIWPNQLIVKVRERRPVAFAKLPIGNSQYRYLLIDAQGVLLAVPRQRFDFPVLTGVREEQSESDRCLRVVAMQDLLRQLGTAASSTISEINAASPTDLRISAKVSGHSVELWLGDGNYLSRFQNFTSHFDEILRQSDGASVFDLRLDDRIMTVR
jgi:cell division protein FtsQ